MLKGIPEGVNEEEIENDLKQQRNIRKVVTRMTRLSKKIETKRSQSLTFTLKEKKLVIVVLKGIPEGVNEEEMISSNNEIFIKFLQE